MRWQCGIVGVVVAIWLTAAVVVHSARPQPPAKPPLGPFGLSMIRTADNSPVDLDLFQDTETCGVCHPRQLEEIRGAMHLASHTDPLYRATAELARKEAGPQVYAFCSGCHSPAGVLSRLIPAKPDRELPAQAKAGVTCDVCHQISALTGTTGPWKEPANASFAIQQGMVKFGNYGDVAENRSHAGEEKDIFSTSELFTSCHTVIQPMNGFHIETTYDEWKAGPFWQKGVQCQDCHMRTVEEAQKVAETLQPVVLKGQSAAAGTERPIHRHFFVGGNANADILAGGKTHAQMAERACAARPAWRSRPRPARPPGRSCPWTCWSTTWAPGTTSLLRLRNCAGCGSRWRSATPAARSCSEIRDWTHTAIRLQGPSPSGRSPVIVPAGRRTNPGRWRGSSGNGRSRRKVSPATPSAASCRSGLRGR